MDDMFTLFDLEVSIEGDPETFVCSHVTGPAFQVISENLVFRCGLDEFSMYALAALLPLLPAKQRPTHAHDWMTTDALIACPDPLVAQSSESHELDRGNGATQSPLECL